MMKRILAVLAMAPLATFAAPAKQAAPAKAAVAATPGEIQVGTLEIRGDSNLGLSFGSEKTEASGQSATGDTNHISLGLTGLYYAVPLQPAMTIGLGGTLKYDDVSQKTQGVTTGESEFKLGPAVGIDFPLAPQLSAFGLFDLVYVRGTQKGGGVTTKASGFGIDLGGGVKYFITKSFSANAGVFLDWTRVKTNDTPKQTISGWDLGVALGLSGYFQLPR